MREIKYSFWTKIINLKHFIDTSTHFNAGCTVYDDLDFIFNHLTYLRLYTKGLSGQVSLDGNNFLLANFYEFWHFFKKMLKKLAIVNFFF